ncbi:MAG: hypothetical protein WDN24_20640 [Sphingomonas sp.]
MPRLIDPGEGGAIGLDELVEALDATPFDARDEMSSRRWGRCSRGSGAIPTS